MKNSFNVDDESFPESKEFKSIYEINWIEFAKKEPEKFKNILDIIKDFFHTYMKK